MHLGRHHPAARRGRGCERGQRRAPDGRWRRGRDPPGGGAGARGGGVPLGPIRPGQAVITGGHGLPNDHVIHCLGPVHGRDEPSDELLASCYREALRLAEEKGLSAVAFPAISTGAFGYPMAEAARVALATVTKQASSLDSVELVRFVLFGEEALEAHERALASAVGE